MATASEIRTRARAAAEEVQREAIAAAVCQVIASEGLDGASLRRIAEALGSTTGLISHYFASKDELLVRALEYAYTQLGADWSPATTRSGDPDEAVTLERLVDGFFRSLSATDQGRQFWLVLTAFRGATVGNPKLAEVYERFSDDMLRAVAEAVASELDLPADDPEVLVAARGISVVLEGFGAAAALDPDQFPPATVRSLVAAAVGGVLANTPRA